jgi:hypothetical protein
MKEKRQNLEYRRMGLRIASYAARRIKYEL